MRDHFISGITGPWIRVNITLSGETAWARNNEIWMMCWSSYTLPFIKHQSLHTIPYMRDTYPTGSEGGIAQLWRFQNVIIELRWWGSMDPGCIPSISSHFAFGLEFPSIDMQFQVLCTKLPYNTIIRGVYYCLCCSSTAQLNGNGQTGLRHNLQVTAMDLPI